MIYQLGEQGCGVVHAVSLHRECPIDFIAAGFEWGWLPRQPCAMVRSSRSQPIPSACGTGDRQSSGHIYDLAGGLLRPQRSALRAIGVVVHWEWPIANVVRHGTHLDVRIR
jgi:hypothetical protein